MPSLLFFIAKIFFLLSWGVQGALIYYTISKIINQQSHWIDNAGLLRASQKNLRKVSYLIFAFLILISVKNFKIGETSCFVCISKWYKANTIFGIIFLCFYIGIKVMNHIYKTEKFYEHSIKSFTNSIIVETLQSIILCFLMSKIVQV